MRIQQLTDLKVRNTAESITEQSGLKIHLTPSGGRVWHWRTAVAGQPRTISFGTYPAVGLAEARRRLGQAKAMVAAGVDPSGHQWQAPSDADPGDRTVQEDMTAWYQVQRATGRWKGSPDVWRSIERDVFPAIGELMTRDVTPKKLAELIDPILERGAVVTAHRIRNRLEWFFDYAEAKGLIAADPAIKLRRTMPKPPKATHFAALTEIDSVRAMLARVEKQIAFPVTKLAHRFHALTAARPGMTQRARWSEMNGLDTDNPVWRLPADRMKTGNDFDLPLTPAAVAILTLMQPISGHLEYVFRGNQDHSKPMSNNGLNKLLKDSGFHGVHVAHSWRTAFSTIMNERHPELGMVIEVCLAHADAKIKGKVGAAYNRALYLAKRRALLTEWADLLLVDQAPVASLLTGPRRRVGRYAFFSEDGRDERVAPAE